MNPLIFEGAGWEKASSSSDIGNCRIRTRIKNDSGIVIYLEINGFERTKYTPRKFPISGYVMHCFSGDCNESSEWRNLERQSEFNYTAENLLRWVNENLGCSFDSLSVVNDGSVQVHGTTQPLCGLKAARQTARGAYAGTPHKTIEELCESASNRVAAGESPWHVRQDIVNGYSLGWQSANDTLIQSAIESGLSRSEPTTNNEALCKQ